MAFTLACGNALAAPSALQQARAAEADHRFDAAREILRGHLQRRPRDGLAWLHLASVATVSGDIVAAQRACDRGAAWLDPVATLGCRGRIALFSQQYRSALSPLLAVLEHPAYRQRTDQLTRWSAGVAAELAVAVGEHDTADALFARALTADATATVPLRAAWLDHLLATHRAEQVVAATREWGEPMPLQLRRLIALKRLDRLGQERAQLEYLDWEYRTALARGEYLHGREIARFYLDVVPQPELARLAAGQNLDTQREAEDYALYQRALRFDTAPP